MNIDKTHNENIDPVCGMSVDQNTKVKPADYMGQTYFFCAEACRKAFETEPQKYLVSSGDKKHKGIWKRYLDRLKKATGGKTPNCCH